MMADKHFFEQLKKKDCQAQKELIQTFNPRILMYFRIRIKGESNYEDLVQEVFGAFFNGLDQGKLAGEEAIAPFIFGIAKRVLFNYYYKQKKNNEIQKRASLNCKISSNFAEADRLENIKLNEILTRLIDNLPRLDKIILKEFYHEEKKITEIAEGIGRSKHYISVRKERALKKIKNEIFRKKLYL